MLNLFYEEPEDDRWLPLDRYPRRIIRRLVHGRPLVGGHKRVFLNLCAGLDRLGVAYRVNRYRHASRHPEELVCIVGKPFLLDRKVWKNPLLFGAATYSHPVDDPDLPERLPIKKILVPGPWMRAMCEPYWGALVTAWPVGIDTELWSPSPIAAKTTDVLLYDKVRWEHDRYEAALLNPIRESLRRRNLSFQEIRYGFYREEDFRSALARCRTMIFLCEHETQGIAYQQALACDVPVFAWDRGGEWQDPAYYPQKVRFGPVSSVPYWDSRCGMKFTGFPGFERRWFDFYEKACTGSFQPRDYILEHLTLEQCAREYVRIALNAGAVI